MLARALLPGCRLSRRNTYRHICSTSRWRCDVKSSTLHTQREGKVLQTAAPYHSGRPIGVKLTKSPSMSVRRGEGGEEWRGGGFLWPRGGGGVSLPPPYENGRRGGGPQRAFQQTPYLVFTSPPNHPLP